MLSRSVDVGIINFYGINLWIQYWPEIWQTSSIWYLFIVSLVQWESLVASSWKAANLGGRISEFLAASLTCILVIADIWKKISTNQTQFLSEYLSAIPFMLNLLSWKLSQGMKWVLDKRWQSFFKSPRSFKSGFNLL